MKNKIHSIRFAMSILSIANNQLFGTKKRCLYCDSAIAVTKQKVFGQKIEICHCCKRKIGV